MTSAPIGAGDRYYVYRPMLDLTGKSEGTYKSRGYNETLGYGAYTNGDVDLISMTLDNGPPPSIAPIGSKTVSSGFRTLWRH